MSKEESRNKRFKGINRRIKGVKKRDSKDQTGVKKWELQMSKEESRTRSLK